MFLRNVKIESKWSINSNNEEFALSRDSKELFVQHFMHFMRSRNLRNSHQGCSIKKLFLKILQYSQENTYWDLVSF